MNDGIKLADSFDSSIRIEVNIDGVKKVESVMFTQNALVGEGASELYGYVFDIVKDTVAACILEKK